MEPDSRTCSSGITRCCLLVTYHPLGVLAAPAWTRVPQAPSQPPAALSLGAEAPADMTHQVLPGTHTISVALVPVWDLGCGPASGKRPPCFHTSAPASCSQTPIPPPQGLPASLCGSHVSPARLIFPLCMAPEPSQSQGWGAWHCALHLLMPPGAQGLAAGPWLPPAPRRSQAARRALPAVVLSLVQMRFLAFTTTTVRRSAVGR